MYSPANSTFLTQESWKSRVPRSAVAVDGDAKALLLSSATPRAESPPPASTATPAAPSAPFRMNVLRSSPTVSSWRSSVTLPPGCGTCDGPRRPLRRLLQRTVETVGGAHYVSVGHA